MPVASGAPQLPQKRISGAFCFPQLLQYTVAAMVVAGVAGAACKFCPQFVQKARVAGTSAPQPVHWCVRD
jgi:hypothetical protein